MWSGLIMCAVSSPDRMVRDGLRPSHFGALIMIWARRLSSMAGVRCIFLVICAVIAGKGAKAFS